MKKILISLLCLGGLLLPTACNMDHFPEGSIPDEDALLTENDCLMFRNGFYTQLRALTAGAYISYPEIQMDQFVGDIGNGNRLGEINNGVILPTNTDLESIFAGIFGGIADINFYFTYSKDVYEKEGLSEEQLQNLERYKAEAYFTRAFFYWYLLDHYCPVYNETNASRNLGLPLVTEYNPTFVKDGYPGRSTLQETYEFIENDLNLAYEGLKDFESSDNPLARQAVVQESPYISTYAVRALQARLALMKGEWQKARDYANEVINSSLFPLTARSRYIQIWTDDTGSEIIFMPFSSAPDELVSSTGGAWISASPLLADYVAVAPLAEAGNPGSVYAKNDTRYVCFIEDRDLFVDGRLVKAPCFIKFPGNPALMVGGNVNLRNKAKVFRTSEMVLIVAEASYRLGDEATANTMLTNLRKVRIMSYKHTDVSGDELFAEIKLERLRELIGEGFRMGDLRRWGEGFTRDCSSYPNYPGLTDIIVRAGANVVYQPNDYRYVWPIPAKELQVNPQMAGQQNPGYPGSSY